MAPVAGCVIGAAKVRRVSTAAVSAAHPDEAAAPSRSTRRADLTVAGLSVLGAVWLTGGLWLDPYHRAVGINSGDQALFEWLLSYGTYAASHGRDPLYTYLLNVPDGANLAVNTSATVLAVVFAPVTWIAGPPISFLAILTLNLVATPYAWYWLISRHLGASPLAAVVGGLFCGFAPAMVSHANAHLNWTAQWLMVLIVWAALRLAAPGGRLVWRGAVLGLLVAAGFSVAAEGLFFTALAVAVFMLVWVLGRRSEARALAGRFFHGLVVAGGVAGALLAYPLWLHFFGPQRYHGIGFDQRIHSEDLAAYGGYPARSLGGLAWHDARLAPNPTEETTFFGIPLLVLVVACFAVLWRAASPDRRLVLRALGVTALVFAVLSLGPRLKWHGDIKDIWLPYAGLAHLPMFDAALPARLALVLTPIVGILLAWTVDHLRSVSGWTRGAWVVAFAVALVPLVPIPLATMERDPVPRFFTSGAWKSYVPDRGTVVPLPIPSDLLPDGQRWQADALAKGDPVFAIPAGFFLGPGPDGRSQIGPIPRPTEKLLFNATKSGKVPQVTEADRAQAREDLSYWRASIVVLADEVSSAHWLAHYDALRETAIALFGPPERVDDVWLWRIS